MSTMKLALTEKQVQDVVDAARYRADDLEFSKRVAEAAVTTLSDKVTHLETEVEKKRTEIWEAATNTENRVRHCALPTVRTLLGAMRGQRKIEAIKAVRELTYMGLKEAKDLVEEFDPIHNRSIYKVYVVTTAAGVKPQRNVVYLYKDGIEITYRPCKNHKESESIGNGMTLALMTDPRVSVEKHYCEPGKEKLFF